MAEGVPWGVVPPCRDVVVGKARQKAHMRRVATCPRAGAPVVGRDHARALVCWCRAPFGHVDAAASSLEAPQILWDSNVIQLLVLGG
jgi:hypothetical protein